MENIHIIYVRVPDFGGSTPGQERIYCEADYCESDYCE